MLVHFYSDQAFVLSGFNLTYTMAHCPFNCSYPAGTCEPSTGTCACDPGLAGLYCER